MMDDWGLNNENPINNQQSSIINPGAIINNQSRGDWRLMILCWGCFSIINQQSSIINP
jgi:hypothetical protein